MFKRMFIVLFAVFTASAFAQPPYGPDMVRTPNGVMNEWEITYYNDADSGLMGPVAHSQWATQKLCFYYAGVVDAHQRYYVVSSTYPGWYGRATQEGDLVRVKMTFWNGRGNDGISFDLTTVGAKDRGMGHWDETVENWSFYGTTFWGNTELRRVGNCLHRSLGEFRKDELDIAEMQRMHLEGDADDAERLQRSPMGLGPEIVGSEPNAAAR